MARATGVRIVGIQRAGERIINFDGKQTLEAGDNLLVAGTLNELRAFRRWLKGDKATPPLPWFRAPPFACPAYAAG